uniref:SCP domain-containing protein n=1 Tax=Schistocephalus solidus TaxID=70667 RepID=A0A0X3P7R9_SCHSO
MFFKFIIIALVHLRYLCNANECHTGRRLGTRINEHKLAIRRRDPLSLVFAHAVDCDHRFNWEGTEVVAMASTKQAREFLEAWHSGTNSINRHVDLDAHYEGLCALSTDLRPP